MYETLGTIEMCFRIACTAIFGLIVGSFLNVCIYRIPKKISLNGNHGRSMCPTCGGTLRWYDLIPVFSFIALRGRCRSCRAPISKQYPIVECSNSMLWAGIIYVLGLTPKAAILCVFASVLIVIAGIDWKTQLIPYQLQLCVLVLGLISLLIPGFPTIGERCIGFLAVSLPMQIIAIIIPNGFGGGDINLMAVAGFFLGYRCIIVAMLIGTILGGAYGMVLMIKGKERKVQIPFGPYLAVGLMMTAVWGDTIWNNYMKLY
ncbi:MAG: prepilin peptidase [Lachnospiraceae bacterium]